MRCSHPPGPTRDRLQQAVCYLPRRSEKRRSEQANYPDAAGRQATLTREENGPSGHIPGKSQPGQQGGFSFSSSHRAVSPCLGPRGSHFHLLSILWAAGPALLLCLSTISASTFSQQDLILRLQSYQGTLWLCFCIFPFCSHKASRCYSEHQICDFGVMICRRRSSIANTVKNQNSPSLAILCSSTYSPQVPVSASPQPSSKQGICRDTFLSPSCSVLFQPSPLPYHSPHSVGLDDLGGLFQPK